MAQRVVKVRKAWKRQTPKVAFPVTIRKPNGETFIVAPTRQRVAKRKPASKRKAKATSTTRPVSAQDTRAIALAERRETWAESQRENDRKLLGSYN